MRETTQVRAMDDYFHSLLLDDALLREDPEDEAPAPALQRQTVAVPEVAAPPYLEADTRLAQLLAQVGQVQFEMDALSHEEVHVEPFQLEAEVVDSEPLVALAEPVVEAVAEEVEPVALAVAEPAPALEAAPAPSTWENLDTGNEFQALFFDVAGVTFAVPLTELGGIHQLGEVTSLFGQPGWYKGIMTSREQKMNVVDTAQWVMPGQHLEMDDYKYLIMLGESPWGLACHQLKGTELLHRDQVKWRHQEGKRPWLAGMVKEKMCALLHVRELLLLLGRGVNIEGR
ncbi:chemotaxis protein CheW [Aeromonas caviae]|uniref:chemotaxis protein CheW n=1 Tax=Aeromonas caviae TaxID=648 RepID=UPI001BD40AA5|nr:chemotaxis protein CheW [Aeromonas caviae]MBS4706624.1 chemotaxis protein CheW [Aeromonas caviae]